MTKIYTCFLAIASLACQWVAAQSGSVSLVPPSGTATTYASIGAAYAAIPTPLTGNYLVEFSAAYSGASETFPIQLTDKGLIAGGNTITIRPAAGNNSAVIQRPVPAAGALIQFNGADNVILDGRPGGITANAALYLTVNDSYSGDNTSRNIEMLNGANSNIVRYVNSFAADAVASGAGARNIIIGAGSTTAGGNNNNTITNCVIRGGQRGIQDSGLSAAVPNIGTMISNDTVRNFGFYGIIGNNNQTNITIQNNYVSLNSYNVPVVGTTVSLIGIRQQSAAAGTSNILNNTISLVSTSPYVSNMDAISDLGVGTENIIGNNIIAVSTPTNPSATINYVVGISLSAFTGSAAATLNVSRNKISGLSSAGAANVRGMEVFPALNSTVNINNNFISVMETNANATAVFGILLGNTASGAYTTNLYYNSMRVGGVQTSTSTASAYGIIKASTNTSSILNQRNNISIMERTGGSATSGFFIGFLLNSTAGTNTVNYNTYYATDAARGFAAGGWDGFIYPNSALANYKAGAGTQEQNSNFASVTFVSATDLHLAAPSNTATTLIGSPVTGISTDIDGQARSATAPYQGADEPTLATPVQLLSFTGEAKITYNTLRWQTATEQNNKGFYLERSADGRNFSSVTFVPSKVANGNSSAALAYTFDDVKPLSSKGYYRLRQVDLDGKAAYSSIVTLAGKTPLALSIASVYPNPVATILNLVVKTPADTKVVMTIIDAAGKSVLLQNATLKTGDNYLSLGTSTLAKGMYTLIVKDAIANETVTIQFIK